MLIFCISSANCCRIAATSEETYSSLVIDKLKDSPLKEQLIDKTYDEQRMKQNALAYDPNMVCLLVLAETLS